MSSDCEQCKSFYLELERLRRLTPTGAYTLNVAHEEEIQRLKDAGEVLVRSLERMTKERDEARDLLRAVAAACRGLGPRTDAVTSVVGNALAQLDEARSEVERLRWGNEMACENTPTAGCECPGCETARDRAVEAYREANK